MSALDNDFKVEGYNNVDADTVAQAASTATQALGSIVSARNAQTVATGCVKPLINVGKKKKAYEECLAKNAQARSMPAPTAPTVIMDSPKFFDTTAGKVTIGVVAIAIIVGGYFAVKKITKK